MHIYFTEADLTAHPLAPAGPKIFTLQRIGDFVDLAQDSSQDDLSLQQAGGSWAPPLNASTARKPRSTFDFQSCYDNARIRADLGARCLRQRSRDRYLPDHDR